MLKRKVSNEELMEFIINFMKKNLYAPTYTDIMEGLGFKSKAHVSERICELRQQGLLEKPENTPRAIMPVGYMLVSEKEYMELRDQASRNKA